MSTRRISIFLTGILASSIAFGANGPQSFLDGSLPATKDPNLFAVKILTVDGGIPVRTPIAVPPGPHWIEIQGVQGNQNKMAQSQTFVLKVAPCTYYYVGARKAAGAGGAWSLVVTEEDTMVACNPAEELKKAQATPVRPPAPKAKPPGK
jgi:hypothetical protein